MPTLAPIFSAVSSDPHFSVVGMFLFLFSAFVLAAGMCYWLWRPIGGGSEGNDEAPARTPANLEPQGEPRAESKPATEGSIGASQTRGGEPVPDEGRGAIDTASDEEAAKQFTSELEEGTVRQDPVYGIVYREAPDSVDDLKKIKGVAKVLEGKLNGVGGYRFKQIAVWTDAACVEFSKMLTFKDRIYRDNWIAQAREFHREKYREEL